MEASRITMGVLQNSSGHSIQTERHNGDQTSWFATFRQGVLPNGSLAQSASIHFSRHPIPAWFRVLVSPLSPVHELHGTLIRSDKRPASWDVPNTTVGQLGGNRELAIPPSVERINDTAPYQAIKPTCFGCGIVCKIGCGFNPSARFCVKGNV